MVRNLKVCEIFSVIFLSRLHHIVIFIISTVCCIMALSLQKNNFSLKIFIYLKTWDHFHDFLMTGHIMIIWIMMRSWWVTIWWIMIWSYHDHINHDIINHEIISLFLQDWLHISNLLNYWYKIYTSTVKK